MDDEAVRGLATRDQPQSGPGAASVTLPTADRPTVTVGCGACSQTAVFELGSEQIAGAQAFLRRHAACLAPADS